MPGRPPKALQMKPTIHAAWRAIGGLMFAMKAKATDSGICAKQMVTPNRTSRTMYSVVMPSPYFPNIFCQMEPQLCQKQPQQKQKQKSTTWALCVFGTVFSQDWRCWYSHNLPTVSLTPRSFQPWQDLVPKRAVSTPTEGVPAMFWASKCNSKACQKCHLEQDQTSSQMVWFE